MADRHVPIIPCHIDTPFFNPAGRKIPPARETHVRFFDCFEADKESSVPEFDLFSLQGDHPLEKHHPVSGKTDRHHVKPFRTGEKISQLEAEIDPVIVVGGLHAPPLDQERGEDIAEKKIGTEGNQAHPDQIFRGQGREKELTDSLVHTLIIKLKAPI